MSQQVPAGLKRFRRGRTKSIERLDRIIKMGGKVGEIFDANVATDDFKVAPKSGGALSPHTTGGNMTQQNAFAGNQTKLQIDLSVQCHSMNWPKYGQFINQTFRENS